MSCFAETKITEYEPVRKNDVRGDKPFVFLRVVGDSMYPLFMEGDLVLVRCQSSVDSGSYAVVMKEEENGVERKSYTDPILSNFTP